ncbi:MAG: hypothetical protein PF541_00040 [Prolixibacteraceae bacterium]|jgi:hypothetical protein|nr:hypothetical protein [Prolixibacteraceae bacterium]
MRRILLFSTFILINYSCWSQYLTLDIDEIIKCSKGVENLLNNKDSIGLRNIIKKPDKLNIRKPNHIEKKIESYQTMNSEGRYLDYERNYLKSFSTDGQNVFYRFRVYVNGKKGGSLLIITFRKVDDIHIELWDFKFSYEKDGEEKKVPEFPTF